MTLQDQKDDHIEVLKKRIYSLEEHNQKLMASGMSESKEALADIKAHRESIELLKSDYIEGTFNGH